MKLTEIEKRKKELYDIARAELIQRGVYLEGDDHAIELYAKWSAMSEYYGALLLKQEAASLEETRVHRLMASTSSQALNWAKQLKLGPYGRQRFGNTAPEVKQEANVSSLRKAN